MTRTQPRVFIPVFCLLILGACSAVADDEWSIGEIAKPGNRVADVVAYLRDHDYKVAYSTSLLSDEIVVRQTPSATDPVGIVEEILRPYGLTIHDVDGIYVISRRDNDGPNEHEIAAEAREEAAEAVAELTVSASRYEILRSRVSRGVFVDQQQIQQLPVPGDDPVRVMHRVPGTASNGVSAKSYVRGGETVDTGIILNGSSLVAPFHLRNLQSLFSTIDVRTIDGIEVFTGGFPVQYGNQMGGLIVIDTIPPTTERHTELGLSVFDASILTSGTSGNSRFGWVVSARRGNLDLVVDERYGKPGYSDFFGQLVANFSEDSSLTLNALVALNDIELVTKSDPVEREESTDHSQNEQFWLDWRHSWTDALNSVVTLSASGFDDHRVEMVDDVMEMTGEIDDSRDTNGFGFSQDWVWQAAPSHQIKWGGAYEQVDGDYVYDGSAEYFGSFGLFQDLPVATERHTDTAVRGETFAAYLADRWTITDATIAELGIRWEKQTYTEANPNGQISPRLSILHSFGPATELRVSVGRYYQAQEMHQLQVEDGVDSFLPPQRADQVIVGLQQSFRKDFAVRAEAYWKNTDRIRPRFENVLNPITVLPEFKPDRVRVAPSAFRSRGIELSVERKPKSGLGWWVSYVWSDAEDTIDGRRIPRSWDQPQALQAGVSWQGEHWDVSVSAAAHSGWPKTSLELDTLSDPMSPALVLTDRNQQRYADFATLDMRVRYRTPVRYGALTVFFDLINATNRRNACCIDFEADAAGADSPSLRIEEKYWLPLIPAAGILWEF